MRLQNISAVLDELGLPWIEGYKPLRHYPARLRYLIERGLPCDYPNADLYQATAYAVATGLDQALLIYAAGEDEPASHEIVHIGKTIDVATMDLSVPASELLAQVERLAETVRGRVLSRVTAAAA